MYQPPNPLSYFTIVWEIVRQIPEGRVSTYGQIASMIPPPEDVDPESYRRLAPRWVGSAMNACPDDVPWQRVINSQGKVSLPAGSSSADHQRARLNMEGVEFDDKGRVDFDRHGWAGPDDEWLRMRGLLRPRSLTSSGSPSTDSPDTPTQLNLL
jgi:methylated-DNA-protein-cysteine methyltransferase-like protein